MRLIMNKQLSRQQLFQFINEVSFAINDIALFLDTHPCDSCALKYYKEYKELREQAMEEYTKCYGPLTYDNVDVDDKWTWACQPWPWEGEC